MTGDEETRARMTGSRREVKLTAAESWRLLGSVPLGRIVFTEQALPAIRPVNHLVDGQAIIIRSHLGADIVSHGAAGDGTVVCYEADDIDAARRTGWSVIATGTARLAADPAAVARYEQQLQPWVDRARQYVVVITPQMITGLRPADESQFSVPAQVNTSSRSAAGRGGQGT